MLEANHNKWAHWFFNPYINKLLKKNFSHFYLVNSFLDKMRDKRIIVTPNHISWWDGFFIHMLNKKILHKKIHLMMLEQQLRRYWFFRKVGAFGINQHSTKSIVLTKKYFQHVYKDSSNMLVMYIQGQIEPFDKQPPTLQKGLRFFAKDLSEQFYVLPLAFKIQYQELKKPAVFVRFGEPVDGQLLKSAYQTYEQSFCANIEQLNQHIFSNASSTDIFKIKR